MEGVEGDRKVSKPMLVQQIIYTIIHSQGSANRVRNLNIVHRKFKKKWHEGGGGGTDTRCAAARQVLYYSYTRRGARVMFEIFKIVVWKDKRRVRRGETLWRAEGDGRYTIIVGKCANCFRNLNIVVCKVEKKMDIKVNLLVAFNRNIKRRCSHNLTYQKMNSHTNIFAVNLILALKI